MITRRYPIERFAEALRRSPQDIKRVLEVAPAGTQEQKRE
jgi:hypothetical protein